MGLLVSPRCDAPRVKVNPCSPELGPGARTIWNMRGLMCNWHTLYFVLTLLLDIGLVFSEEVCPLVRSYSEAFSYANALLRRTDDTPETK